MELLEPDVLKLSTPLSETTMAAAGSPNNNNNNGNIEKKGWTWL